MDNHINHIGRTGLQQHKQSDMRAKHDEHGRGSKVGRRGILQEKWLKQNKRIKHMKKS